MKVPERIYIDDPTGEFDDHWNVFKNDNSIEYIRKDIFIKKTEECMYKQLNEGHMECSNIKAFLENFKKYIEK